MDKRRVLEIEAEAVTSHGRLLDEVKRIQQLYVACGREVPEEVDAFVRATLGDSIPGSAGCAYPMPGMLPRPMEAQEDWIPIPYEALSASSLVKSALSWTENIFTDLKSMVAWIQQKTSRRLSTNSIWNVLVRNKDSVVRFTEVGWELVDPFRAPVLFEGHGWGPMDLFTPQEFAAYRRAIVLHLIETSAGGLKAREIQASLPDTDLGEEVHKDTLRMDLRALEKDLKIRKVPATKKWKIV